MATPKRGTSACIPAAPGEIDGVLGAAFESAFDAIFVVDDTRNCLHANQAACELLGLERDRIVGTSPEILAAVALPQPCHKASAQENLPLKGESTIRRPSDGESREIEYVVRTNIVPGRHVVILRDLTSRKQLEQQIHESQKMEALGRLAGGVAHDFNNMLTVIRGYGELLAKKMGNAHPLSRYVFGIINAADRSADITQQFLAFSRRQIAQPRVLNINEVVSETSHLLQRLLGEDIELRMVLAPDAGQVNADPSQLGQVLLNLAINARDAMPSGGKLLIQTENVEMDAAYCGTHATTVTGLYVLISVTDNGCGMDPEIRSQIFEPFFTTKGQGKGTGLGLATVFSIVKQSGGYIWVYSEKGQGTTFKIYLPRVDVKPAESVAGEYSSLRGHGEIILVIEDEENTRIMVSEFLREQGYRVFEASGGNDALAICEKPIGKIHLVLTDVVMPGTSGEDLAGYMATRYSEAKVLYMSGFPCEELRERGVAIEPGCLMQKPFRLADLLARIRILLDETPN